ncbi:hypothetical protein ACIBI4_05185 [Streptomyces sp. NPDC050418]|uniref:hypothetical protein n=1 Tax=Streptomyces sp. NPDC050418 TaxID=3365612 RepID=UPI0037AB5E98
MRSLKIATGTVLASAALLLSAPMASAADTRCDPATAAALEAESAYKSAQADYQKTVDGGGHPGQAEQDNVADLKQKADAAASEAQRICGDTTVKPGDKKPSGAMHTGSGSTSEASTQDLTGYTAAAAAIAVAAAAGYAARRRTARSGR